MPGLLDFFKLDGKLTNSLIIMRLSVQKYGLIGWPVSHSLSPPMQNAGFDSAGIQAKYSLIEVSPDKMKEVIPQMKEEFSGWNCTVPHKQHIIDFVDELDEVARVLGSVNTIVNENGRLKGYSTDGYGMEISIKESFDQDIKGNSFLFIGAGGAARAVALYFALKGAAKIAVLNRSVGKAEDLIKEIKEVDQSIQVEAAVIDSTDFDPSLYNIVIQSTSLGLHDGDPSPYDVCKLNSKQFIVDMIYKKTDFLKKAEELGCKTADGRGMLLFQGVRAWEIWTGQKAPVEDMRKALYEAMN